MGTGTYEDVFNLIAIGGRARCSGTPGIEHVSPDPLSSPLPRYAAGTSNGDMKTLISYWLMILWYEYK